MTIDTKALRELAQQATPGPWCAQQPNAGDSGCEVAAFGGIEQVCDGLNEANAAFIAAANPQTILALLDTHARMLEGAAIGRMARLKMASGNSVQVERCVVTKADVEKAIASAEGRDG